MTILKMTFATLLKAPAVGINGVPKVINRSLHMPCKTTSKKAEKWSNSKLARTEEQITENLKLIRLQNQQSAPVSDNSSNQDKPLVLILEWLMAKNQHIYKFADMYLKHGFDVLSVKLKPWQLIWPLKGSQLVARDLLNTLYQAHSQRPIIIHGLSVGGYLWGEVQVKMSADLEKYKPLINNICGAIWDSAVDINETAVGVPAAMFPNNLMLQNAFRKYILYHMKAFEKEATQHWRLSRDFFYRPIVTCPALLLFSNTDPIGNPTSYKNVRLSYESLGIQIYEKCWDQSPHVAHFAYHRDEYIAQVEMFLENIGVLAAAQTKRAAVL